MSNLTEYRLKGAPGLWQFWAEADGGNVWLAALDADAAHHLERQDAWQRDGMLVLVPQELLGAVGVNYHQPPLF